MTTPHSATRWTGCACGGDRPCARHPETPSTGDNLWSEEELKAGEVELIARQQHNALEELSKHATPAMRGSIRLWGERLKELGVVPR